jgi:isocitrate/isopropylmalate dehydrogenase
MRDIDALLNSLINTVRDILIAILSSEAEAPRSVRAARQRNASKRADRQADYALKNGHKKVTVVHKANVLKALTDVFLEVVAAPAWGR